MQLVATALERAFLVVRRDHLADQPEREELHPDDNEQHAERQQRPMPDRATAQPEDRQVDADQEPDPAEGEPESPKRWSGRCR